MSATYEQKQPDAYESGTAPYIKVTFTEVGYALPILDFLREREHGIDSIEYNVSER